MSTKNDQMKVAKRSTVSNKSNQRNIESCKTDDGLIEQNERSLKLAQQNLDDTRRKLASGEQAYAATNKIKDTTHKPTAARNKAANLNISKLRETVSTMEYNVTKATNNIIRPNVDVSTREEELKPTDNNGKEPKKSKKQMRKEFQEQLEKERRNENKLKHERMRDEQKKECRKTQPVVREARRQNNKLCKKN